MLRIDRLAAPDAAWGGAMLAVMLLFSACPGLAQQASNKSGSNQTFPGMKLSGDKPIQIESDKLEVHQKDNTAIFTGNVNVVQGTTLMKAGRMIVQPPSPAARATSRASMLMARFM